MPIGWPVGESCETGPGHVRPSGGGSTGVGVAGLSLHAGTRRAADARHAEATVKEMRRPKMWYRLTVAPRRGTALEPERRPRIGRHCHHDDVRAFFDRRSAPVGRVAAVAGADEESDPLAGRRLVAGHR